MIKTKVYLYDSSQESNGYRGTEYSNCILQGQELTEDITQEMDTAEITLCGLNTNKEFDPETKFIVDIWDTDANGNDVLVSNNHFCVDRDVVSQPILSDDNYFDHHISFIEPSVIAQKRLVDNIAVTYKLKDVSLEEIPAFPIDETSTISIQSSTFVPAYPFGISSIDSTKERLVYGKYFKFSEGVAIGPSNEDLLQFTYLKYNNILNFDDNGIYKAKFIIPPLKIYANNYGTSFRFVGNASIDYKVEEFDPTDLSTPLHTWSGTFIENNSVALASPEYYWTVDGVLMNETYMPTFKNEWILENIYTDGNAIGVDGMTHLCFRKYTDVSAPSPPSLRFTQEIELREDKKYLITISLHEFPDNIPYTREQQNGNIRPIYQNYEKYLGSQPNYFLNIIRDRIIVNSVGAYIYTTYANAFISSQTTGVAEHFIYGANPTKIVYASSIPYSALALLQKAIINSSVYEKKDGTYIADINQSNLPFYIDENYIDKLSATLIIENFYNQKNLWEIMLEVGNYIHAVPELKFGNDDRFMITFNQLGRTDEKTDNSTKVSIFNSKSVEDYICATSSYITNMVQLGGLIEEWVAPKTTDETLLISNDTAEIVLSKPIIELISITVRQKGTGLEADLTPFIYEENVYKTLSIDYSVNPNRGIAMYYKLGTNVITGGQFQLPTANTNIYSDYAFKKIIWCAYNGYFVNADPPATAGWTNLQVNDYTFFVTYRTKDSVRQNHIRPDLRKYLVNSKYDRFPEHNQFNNQTDVVVDSIKFGNNMYGKLIKTGNSSYTKAEWSSHYTQIKHKGELYRINGELYYVAKAKHFIFATHIISNITFSKDYNELSKVVGIPSEPRFYEISEQSLIWREFALNDILLLTDDKSQLNYKSNYVFNFNHLGNLIVGEGTDFAKYAVSVFKADKDVSSYDQTVGQSNYYKEVINAVNAYSSENTLTYEWDMGDNYSAGDKVINSPKNNYNSLWAVPYTDIYGKVALLDFYLLGDIGSLSSAQKMAIPESPIKTKNDDATDTRPFVGNYDVLGTNVLDYDTNFLGRGIGLLKDCREAISINFNLELATNSDTFVISPYVFLPNKQNVRLVLLAEEVNKLSNGYIDNSTILTPLDTDGNTMSQLFTFNIEQDTETINYGGVSKTIVKDFGIDFSSVFANVNPNHFNGNENYQQVKAIALLCDVSLNTGVSGDSPTIPYKTQFIFARNIPSNWDKERALRPIWFGAPNKNLIFRNKQ